jgi:hypothetical protein
MRPIVFGFALLFASVAFGATRADGAGASPIDRRDFFAEKTEAHTYTLNLDGKRCLDLKFGGQITSGRILWRLTDPNGKERMAVETTRRLSSLAEDIKSIPGKWTLTIEIENATGQSWVQWQR